MILTISIHAPSRERPFQASNVFACVNISIHAPSRERLFLTFFYFFLERDFNPRSLAGATAGHGVTLYYSGISIHAPSRERPLFLDDTSVSITFQSTLPRGSDPALFKRSIIVLYISIHAPSRERLQSLMYIVLLKSISIHAPSRERLRYSQY